MKEELRICGESNGIIYCDANENYRVVAQIAIGGGLVTYRKYPLSGEAKAVIEKHAARIYISKNSGIPSWTQELIPVMVRTQINDKLTSIGIQYWTPEKIDKGENINPDKSISHYLMLHQPITNPLVKLDDWENAFGDRFGVTTMVEDGHTEYFKTFTQALDMFNRL